MGEKELADHERAHPGGNAEVDHGWRPEPGGLFSNLTEEQIAGVNKLRGVIKSAGEGKYKSLPELKKAIKTGNPERPVRKYTKKSPIWTSKSNARPYEK